MWRYMAEFMVVWICQDSLMICIFFPQSRGGRPCLIVEEANPYVKPIMKTREKDLEKLLWDQMTANSRSSPGVIVGNSTVRALPKLMAWFILFISITYFIYTLKLLSSRSCPPFSACDNTDCPHKSDDTAHPVRIAAISANASEASPLRETLQGTDLSHIVFGIAASSRLWEKRKNYIKLWWKPKEMRGIVWLDNPVKMNRNEGLPPVKISGNTSRFSYTNRQGHRSAIRISRIVSETLRLGLNDVQWFVMGDDDTFFVQENLVRVLSKYDHREFYYIGSSSESHLQNIYFSYGMAYGGGGFAISYPLAKALDGMQDRCIQRYPGLYGSDDRMQACMSELGVPLTKEPGFHQYDVYGNLFGLLAAHPVTPLVSLHHLDVVEPIFPNMTRVEALRKLQIPMRLDSAGLMQQSICYEKSRGWTVSVSWGFSVQILRGIFSPREMEMPSRTFLNWYRRADYTAYAFNTRPVSRHPCQKPFVFYLSAARSTDRSNKNTVTEYVRHMIPEPDCKWKMPSPALVQRVVVRKKSDPFLWDKAPRRNCCRILPTRGTNRTVSIEVGSCRQGEISQL